MGGSMQRFYFISLFILLNCVAFSQVASNIVKVTTDGYSYLGEEETIKVAKERAMKDAERKAIEEGTGLYLESYSKVHNYMVVEDEIKSLAAGYITSKKVLVDELESNPPRYHVRIEAEVKCGDLDQLMEAKKEEDQPQPMGRALSVEFAMVAERKMADGTWGEVLVKDGGELKSFDKFQIHVQPGSNCYLYLLFYDSQGKASVLFPSKEMGLDNLVKKDAEIRAPGPDLYYELDAVTGRETVYLIASAKPMQRLNWLLEKMEKAGGEVEHPEALVRSIRARGIGRVTTGGKASFSLSDGKRIEKVTEVLKGRGAVVRKVSFNHLP